MNKLEDMLKRADLPTNIKVGVVSFMAFPDLLKGEASPLETEKVLRLLTEDDFFEAVEISWFNNSASYAKAKEILSTSKLKKIYGVQPPLLIQGLDLNSFDEKKRLQAVEEVKRHINTASDLNADAVAILSGKYPGWREEKIAADILINSLKEICLYAKEKGLGVHLETFDKTIDKRCLVGDARLAAKIARDLRKVGCDNFGLIYDLSHEPLLKEIDHGLGLEILLSSLTHVHVGNAVLDRQQEDYGDRHPFFGVEGGSNNAEQLADYLMRLRDNTPYFERKDPIISFEVCPTRRGQTSEMAIQNIKDTLHNALEIMIKRKEEVIKRLGYVPKIFATCDIGQDALRLLRSHGYKVEVCPDLLPPPKDLILEKIKKGINGLITTLRDPIDEEVFKKGKENSLKVISQMAVGVDNIDGRAASNCGIPYTNTPDVLTDATAEWAFFMLGDLSRKLSESERIVRDGEWSAWHPYLPFVGTEVTGKIILVVGTGRIGKAVIQKCIGFDMDIICYNLGKVDEEFVNIIQKEMDVRHENGRRKSTIRYVKTLEQGLKIADYVTLHVPLITSGKHPTYHMIGAKEFKLMKEAAFLINTSRGQVVDENALYEAVMGNEIAGAALDVYETEPLPKDSPLRDKELYDRVRLYNHGGSSGMLTRLSADPEKGMAGRTVYGLISVIEDFQQKPYVVNREIL